MTKKSCTNCLANWFSGNHTGNLESLTYLQRKIRFPILPLTDINFSILSEKTSLALERAKEECLGAPELLCPSVTPKSSADIISSFIIMTSSGAMISVPGVGGLSIVGAATTIIFMSGGAALLSESKLNVSSVSLSSSVEGVRWILV